MNWTQYKKYINASAKRGLRFLKWLALAVVIGVVVGLIGTLFAHCMTYVIKVRTAHPGIIWGLPIAGLLIVALYHLAHRDNDTGTNSVLAAVRSEEELSIVMAPLIFVSTLLTHLCGGSAGREGAALQLGGSIGNQVSKVLHMNRKEQRIMIMCGMSACFAALFGTPMAAAIFSMEVVNVGMMYYPGLVPCVVSSLVAFLIARRFGVAGEAMSIGEIPEFTFLTGGKIIILAALCALLSVIFCLILHFFATKDNQLIPNPYLRIAVGGALVAGITALLHTTDYMGASMHLIEKCVTEGEVRPEAFLCKMLLTAITLGVGYKGGEIVPSFCVGATFGCLVGGALGLSPSLCAAVGMVALFCGVTNSPITSLVIAFELFGMEAYPYLILGIAVSFALSGYHSLYYTQRILHNKNEAEDRDGDA